MKKTKMKRPRTIVVTNRHIQNYLGQKKIWPIEDYDDSPAVYLNTKELRAALESYNIEFYMFPNRHT